MVVFIATFPHYADVVPARRRKEERRMFRLELPIEVAEISESEMTPGIDFELRGYQARDGREMIRLPAWGGRLWQPVVPPARRERNNHCGIPYVAQKPTAAATVAEFTEGGVIYSQDGERSETAGFPRGAMPRDRLVDGDHKEVLWTSQPDIERRLPRVAARLLVVDGRMWQVADEPVLYLKTDARHRWIETTSRDMAWYSPRVFRIDRADDMLRWANSPIGRARGALFRNDHRETTQRRLEIDRIEYAFTIHRPEVLQRDDARELLRGIVPTVLFGAKDLLHRFRHDAVDDFVMLKRFQTGLDTRPTPELYAALTRIVEAAESCRELDAKQYGARAKVLKYAGHVLPRWKAFEAPWHAARADAAPAVTY